MNKIVNTKVRDIDKYDTVISEADKKAKERGKVINSRGKKVDPRKYHLSDQELNTAKMNTFSVSNGKCSIVIDSARSPGFPQIFHSSRVPHHFESLFITRVRSKRGSSEFTASSVVVPGKIVTRFPVSPST